MLRHDPLKQTILRAADGRRWVVTTATQVGAYVTTARPTGCDLRPRFTRHALNLANALAQHAHMCARIRRGEDAAAVGRPAVRPVGPGPVQTGRIARV
ncbi:MAG: hypothetical protein FJ033_03310 [Chloroflexi bacterium]|nr:hypothetical protein [Chloroflexota bacterium]